MPEPRIEADPPTSIPGVRSLVVRHVRFVSHPVTGTRIRTTFKHPRPCLAVEQTIEVTDLPRDRTWPESVDSLHVVYVPPQAKDQWEKIGAEWLTPPNDPDAPQAVTVPLGGDLIHWRPGRAVVEGEVGLRDEVMAALTQFAFYEAELRTLELAIDAREADARTDAPRAYRIRRKDRAVWPRFGEMIESLAQLRITFAALKPRLARGARALPKPARRHASRLLAASGAGHRLEGLDGRLEVCEELYEGANDRVADHHGWFTGHVLEIIIVALLILEGCLMAADVLLRLGE